MIKKLYERWSHEEFLQEIFLFTGFQESFHGKFRIVKVKFRIVKVKWISTAVFTVQPKPYTETVAVVSVSSA